MLLLDLGNVTVNHIDDLGYTPLHIAAKYNQVKEVYIHTYIRLPSEILHIIMYSSSIVLFVLSFCLFRIILVFFPPDETGVSTAVQRS